MSAEPRHLRPVDPPPDLLVVDPTTGDTQPLSVVMAEAESEYEALQAKYRGALAEITKLKKDTEVDARKHKMYAEGEAVHTWWRLACGHPGTEFGAEEFYKLLPHLKKEGPIVCLQAIAGAAYDPGERQLKNGRMERYDDFELIFRSAPKMRSFINRAPGPVEGHDWKRWLLAKIEADFKS